MTPETLKALRDSIAPYGYTLSDAGMISTPSGKPTDAVVSVKAGRLLVRMRDKLLWSGRLDSLPQFLERYWYASKV